MTKVAIDADEVFTVEETASLLGVSRATMFNYVRDCKVIPIKILGRNFITKSEIERYKKNPTNQVKASVALSIKPKGVIVLEEEKTK